MQAVAGLLQISDTHPSLLDMNTAVPAHVGIGQGAVLGDLVDMLGPKDAWLAACRALPVVKAFGLSDPDPAKIILRKLDALTTRVGHSTRLPPLALAMTATSSAELVDLDKIALGSSQLPELPDVAEQLVARMRATIEELVSQKAELVRQAGESSRTLETRQKLIAAAKDNIASLRADLEQKTAQLQQQALEAEETANTSVEYKLRSEKLAAELDVLQRLVSKAEARVVALDSHLTKWKLLAASGAAVSVCAIGSLLAVLVGQ